MVLPPLVLVLGGARSGKSRFAEAQAERAGRPVLYIATAGEARDGEMAERIAVHQARRSAEWTTVEAPLELADALGRAPEGAVTLVDCLTLWLTNVMLAERDVAAESERLLAALGQRRGPVLLVSNEVGLGIVPMTALGRAFRDAQGVLNQRCAAVGTDVILLVAGRPVVVKPSPEPELRL